MPKAKRSAEPSGNTPLLLPEPAVVDDDVQAAETARRRWGICLKVSLVAMAIYFVLKIFGYLFFSPGSEGPSPAPAPAPPTAPHETPKQEAEEEWTDPLCDIPVESYPTTQLVVDQCKSVKRWQSQAGISMIDDGGCFFNKTSGEIDCSRKESCHGGQKKVHTWDAFRRNLTYDCGSECKGTLKVNCCKTCNSVRQNDKEFIHCLGCEKDKLQHIVNKNLADCSLDDNGFFSCEAKDSCIVKPHGLEHQVKVTHSLTCSIVPCDVCTTPQLRAKCCSICLADLCGHPTNRKVCTGCGSSALSEYVFL